MITDVVTLFAQGCLGTCWYGRYHYLEPWIGCEFNCWYCYAKTRYSVLTSLEQSQTTFDNPVLLYASNQLIDQIIQSVERDKINIIKLCRYTDIFSPKFVQNGLSYKVLEALCQTSVNRIIITTKGVPNSPIINLIKTHKDKFSFNVTAKPEIKPLLEQRIPKLEERLRVAAELNGCGVLTTIHMDPFIAGWDDQIDQLTKHLKLLQEFGLKRIMFSYLLLSDIIVRNMQNGLDPEIIQDIIWRYDKSTEHQYVPEQEDSNSFTLKFYEKERSITTVSELLTKMGFNFVLCSLKSGRNVKIDKKSCPLCNGTFYA